MASSKVSKGQGPRWASSGGAAGSAGLAGVPTDEWVQTSAADREVSLVSPVVWLARVADEHLPVAAGGSVGAGVRVACGTGWSRVPVSAVRMLRWGGLVRGVETLPGGHLGEGPLVLTPLGAAMLEDYAVALGLTRVAVYGTLLRGQPNNGVLAGAQRLDRGEAAVEGLGLWESAGGAYPAGAVVAGDLRVACEVYAVDGPTLARLRRLEGVPDLYREVRLPLASGARAWGYVQPLERARAGGVQVVAREEPLGAVSWKRHLVERPVGDPRG